jgi:hypothetical protein
VKYPAVLRAAPAEGTESIGKTARADCAGIQSLHPISLTPEGRRLLAAPELRQQGKTSLTGLTKLLRRYRREDVSSRTTTSKIGAGQVWAIRRCGELLAQEPSAKGGQRYASVPLVKSRKALAKRHALTDREYKRALRFAAVAEKMFDEIVEDDNIPTLTALEKLGKNALRAKERKAHNARIAESHEEEDMACRLASRGGGAREERAVKRI